MDRKEYQRQYYQNKKRQEQKSERLKDYLDIYDNLNPAELTTIEQLVDLESSWLGREEDVVELLNNKEYSKAKQLVGAFCYSVNSFVTLQKSLGIDRKTRLKQNEDYNVIQYLEDLKANAEPVQRLRKLYCNHQNVPLDKRKIKMVSPFPVAKYKLENGTTKFEFIVECPICGDSAVVGDVE